MGRPHGPYFVRVLGSRLKQEVHMRKPKGMYKHFSISCSHESLGIAMQVLGKRRTSGGHQGLYLVRVLGSRIKQELHLGKPIGICWCL